MILTNQVVLINWVFCLMILDIWNSCYEMLLRILCFELSIFILCGVFPIVMRRHGRSTTGTLLGWWRWASPLTKLVTLWCSIMETCCWQLITWWEIQPAAWGKKLDYILMVNYLIDRLQAPRGRKEVLVDGFLVGSPASYKGIKGNLGDSKLCSG